MEEKALIQSTLKFEDFWKTSCYHLEEDVPKKSTTMAQLIVTMLSSSSCPLGYLASRLIQIDYICSIGQVVNTCYKK